MAIRFSKQFTIGQNSKSNSANFNAEMDNIYNGLNTLDADKSNLAGTGRTTETVKGNADALTAHKADMANPHAVTAAQVGAYTKSESDTTFATKAGTYDRVTTDAKINQATGTATVLSGTAFPSNPNDGQLFWHKTLLTLFTYDLATGKWETAKAPQLPQLLDFTKASFSRASVAYGKGGNLHPYNAMRTAQGKYGQGAFIEEGTTNIFDAAHANSFASVWTSGTLNGTYTVSIKGSSGSLSLTGGATGTVNAGGSLTFTVTNATVTFTPTGSPAMCQLEQKGYATSYIDGGATRQPDSLSYPLSQPLPSKSSVVIVWKPDADTSLTTRNFVFYSTSNGGTQMRHRLRFSKNDGFRIVKFIGDGSTNESSPPNILTTAKQGDTFFIVMADDQTADNVSLWVGKNGDPLVKVSMASVADYTDVARVGIGSNVTDNSDSANGTIDLPIISDTIPTDEQVEALYRSAELGGNRHFPNPTQLLNQPAWAAPTLVNAWVNDTPVAGYYKDSTGQVRLKGRVKSGTITAGTTIFNLPVGMRPSGTTTFPAVNSNGTTIVTGSVTVDASGNVQTQNVAYNTWLSLDDITFRAEQ